MPRTFFPDPVFGWVFCLTLIALTSIAAWTDTKRAKIPNRLCLVILALGLAANIVRGAMLGTNDQPLWIFDTGSVWLGLLDGLLFSLVGFAVAFVSMFLMWIFGACGGGDVKLMAGIGAWLSLPYFLWVWVGSVVVLFFWMAGRVAASGLTPRKVNKTLDEFNKARRDHEQGRAAVIPKRKLRMTYSLPLVIALVLVLAVMFRYELRLDAPKSPPPQSASAHDRPSPPQ